MVKIVLPQSLIDVNEVATLLMDIPKPALIEIDNPVLTRKIGYYMRPLTVEGLIRIMPGENDRKGSIVICKSRTVVKKVQGPNNKYIFSNEKIKIPRL